MAITVIKKVDPQLYKVRCTCGASLRFEASDIIRGESTYRDEGAANYTITCPNCLEHVILGYGFSRDNIIRSLQTARCACT